MNNIRLIGLWLSLGALLLAATTWRAPNATYYVAPPPAGDDANPGSQAAPWATLQHAVESVGPGDIILVQSGTYAGARIEVSGAADAPITLKAAPGASVLVDGSLPNNNAHGSALEIETWEGAGVVAYWVIEGLEVANAPGWGIDSRGNDVDKNHHITIRGNRVHNNGVGSTRTGIFAAFTDYVLVENNETYANTEHGIYINNSSDYFTVRGNSIHDNHFSGLHLNGDLSMGGDGTLSFGLIENNRIVNNGYGGAAINMDGVTDSVIRNNLLVNNHASGIAVFQIDAAVCSRDNLFVHNTIHMPGDGRWAFLIADPACTGNQVFNNIFLNDHGYRGSINLAGGIPQGFESDYNVVMDRFTTDDGDTVISLAEWQALGFDLHSLTATTAQLCGDAPGGYYHLRAGSPAIDAASDQGVTSDLDGSARPAGAGYDIGAYEYGSSAATPTATLTPGPSATPTVTLTPGPPSPTPTATRTPGPTPTPGPTSAWLYLAVIHR